MQSPGRTNLGSFATAGFPTVGIEHGPNSKKRKEERQNRQEACRCCRPRWHRSRRAPAEPTSHPANTCQDLDLALKFLELRHQVRIRMLIVGRTRHGHDILNIRSATRTRMWPSMTEPTQCPSSSAPTWLQADPQAVPWSWPWLPS